MRLVRNSLKFKINKISFSFNVNNYNKPLLKENISRLHNKFLYDEYKNIQTDLDY
jgi:hypothetical protein